MSALRTILHVDMDAFFASVEQHDRPELRGKPVLVGSDRPRGVVCAASYEARVFGCRSAQPMAMARRRCPQAIVVPPRHGRYHEVSELIVGIFESFASLIEPLSVDEAFLDVTGSERLFGSPRDLALKIKREIRETTGLTASVGIAPNKFLAKLASEQHKPDGLTLVLPEEVEGWLAGMPVGAMWGVGPVTEATLHRHGLRTIGHLQAVPIELLTRLFGSQGEHFCQLARGIDDRPVVADRQAKSISQEQTFEEDLENREEVEAILRGQVEDVARRLRRAGLLARTVTVKIRYGDFETITRSTSLDEPSDSTATLIAVAAGLFDRWAHTSFQPVRLIGMGVSQFGGGLVQGHLFQEPQREKDRRLDQATDRIVDKFGEGTIRRGAALSAGRNRDDSTGQPAGPENLEPEAS